MGPPAELVAAAFAMHSQVVHDAHAARAIDHAAMS
jgi:hypothetical protein